MAKRERYWLEQRGATLNKQVPSRTKSEYYVDNQENFKQYRADNKEKNIEFINNYRKENGERIECPCGGII
jgi:hypothetical protein